MLTNAQKYIEKKSILFRDEPYVSPLPLVPRVHLQKPVTIKLKRTMASSSAAEKKLKEYKVTVTSWPKDQIQSVPIVKIPADHDDSETE